MKKIYILLIILLFSILDSQTVDKDNSYIGDFNLVNTDIPFIAKTGEVYKLKRGYSMVKFLTNGNLDTNFGINGSATVLPISTQIKEVKNDGIYTLQYNYNVSNKIVKYSTTTGNIDTAFGNNGVSEELFPSGSGEEAKKMVVNTDNSIYVLLSGNRIKKLLPNGFIDTAFGTKTFDNNAMLLETQDNSLLIQFVKNDSQAVLIRYTPQGILDTNYGNNGEVQIELPTVGSFYLYTNSLNDVFIFAIGGGTYAYKITKYTSNGIDNEFGTNGYFTFKVSDFQGTSSLTLSKIQFDSNNNLIIQGPAFFSGMGGIGYIIIKYKSNGTPDYTFNRNLHFYAEKTGYDTGIHYNDGRVIDDNTFLSLKQIRLVSLTFKDIGTKYIRNPTLGIDINQTDDNIKLFPNPVNAIAFIRLNSKEKLLKINVYSTDGKLVSTAIKEQINMQNLSPGNYLLEVITDKKIYSKKILKK